MVFILVRRLSAYTEDDVWLSCSESESTLETLKGHYRNKLKNLGFDPHLGQAYKTIDLEEDLEIIEVKSVFQGREDVPLPSSGRVVLVTEKIEGFGQVGYRPLLIFNQITDLMRDLWLNFQKAQNETSTPDDSSSSSSITCKEIWNNSELGKTFSCGLQMFSVPIDRVQCCNQEIHLSACFNLIQRYFILRCEFNNTEDSEAQASHRQYLQNEMQQCVTCLKERIAEDKQTN